ncbi:translocation/assembly module TamB [Marnyiella aurantia]|uniref:Translocation/assembly module TamB n=1 Tax=Marnyiella aurantia TaxID=2758037 RepID=A0A7D7LMB8_9FLAO|nr:translocation/assembly module TamB [Marnyiella aurantia]MBA5246327.1 translocation/assembly module TamB [Marnyiella aurantia]QMS98302.1 translocation/assembly module TamB [Marnyiella aurantia]
MKNFKKVVKYAGIAIGSLILLIVLAVLSLQLPTVQNFVKGKLVNYLEEKIHTKVTLDRVFVAFPNSLVMENLYLQDQKKDTLLFARKMDVGLNIPKLLKSTADLTSVDLAGVRANVVRRQDGSFNFDYILEAFATKDAEESESKPFIISLDRIKLNDIGVSFEDLQARNDVKMYFKSFDTRVRTFDLQNNSYAVNDIIMDGLRLRLKQDLLEEVAEEVEQTVDSLNQRKPMQLGLNRIKLTNFDIDYGDDNTKTFGKVKFAELSSKVNKLDLQNSDFVVDNVTLKGADINAKLFMPASGDAATNDNTETNNQNTDKSLALQLNRLTFDDVRVVYDNTAIPVTRRGMDFNHLNFSELDLEVRNFQMKDGTFAGTVNSAVVREGRGLDIRRFETDFVYGEKQAYLKDLYLQTSKTLLRDELVLNYNSPEQLSANPGAARISANLQNSKVGFSDILMLVPSLSSTVPFNKYPNAVVNVNTRLKGSLNDLQIQHLQLSGIDRLKVNASGNVKNAMNPDNLLYDLNIRELSSDARTVQNLLPENTLPSNITLPSFFRISGLAKGSTQVVNTNLKLTTTLGNAAIRASVDMRRKNQERYDILANLQNLQIGTIIQNKDLRSVTGQIAVKGQGFDPNRAIANLKGNISSVHYNGYTYRNMNLAGTVNRGAYIVNLDSKDPNANLKLRASGVFSEKNPSIKVNGNIQKLDLNKLGFYKDQMILAGELDGDFTSLDPDAPNGYLYLRNFAVSDTKDVFPLQEVALTARSTADSNSISLQSQIADVDLTGKYKLTQIFGSLMQTVNQYYQFQSPGTATASVDPNQYFSFNAKVKDDDLLRRFVPQLTSFEPVVLTGNYVADTRQLQVNGQIPQVTYGKNNIRGGVITVSNADDALVYDVSLDEFKNESIALMKVNLNGNVRDNLITYNASTKDEKDATKFLLAGTAEKIGDLTEISLNPDGLILDYTNWQVAAENSLQIGSRGIVANNFAVSNAGSEIRLQSETNVPNSPLNVTIRDFKIESITEILKKDSLLAKGNINGTAQLRDLKNNMTFTSDLAVTDLFVYGNPVGNVDVKVNSESSQLLRADVQISGNDNDVQLLGTYNTSSGNLDMNLDMNRLQMQTVQGLSLNAIENAEGYLSGDLKIAGNLDAPSILGDVKFNDVGLGITQLGSKFSNINDEINFTTRGIDFDDFQIKDESGNAITIDGSVLTESYRDFAFNLDVDADDFKVVDSKKDNDKLMYGVLAVDAGLRIRGDLDLPRVDGSIAVTDVTDFTFVLPQSSPALEDREGIVEFIDQDQIALRETVTADSLTNQSDIKGLDVNVNIEVTKEAKISLLIDKANGDFVALQGEAQLTGGIDPSGKTTLVGVYEVDQGAYEMSVSLLRRKFEIQKGSTITWTGEPTTANLDVTAVYKTDAAPLDLLQQQLTGVTGNELNQYKQRIPFNTLLIMRGELMKPVITFDITTDEENSSVSATVLDNTRAKLDQLRREEAEMNKQVFALLLLNRFIGENPFQSETGLSASTLAKQSVSRILSEQLNNLAADLVGGVELNFDLESTEDYSSGSRNERTDLNVDLSKRLFDDRLKVTVGNNFGILGDTRQNEQTTNIAGDVTLDYSLSKDGRYMLRAYRKNDYQVALQGQVIETGVGFIITLDYDKFREIFERSRKQRERKTKTENTTTK